MHVEIFTDRGSQNTLNEGGKKVQMNLFTKQKNQRYRKKTYGYQGMGGAINWEIVIDIYTLLYIKWITNKNLLYNKEDSTQYSVLCISYVGTEPKKKWTYAYIYITDSLCCTAETNTIL